MSRGGVTMKRHGMLIILLAAMMWAAPGEAQTQRLIVRDKLGVKGIQASCQLVGCNVLGNLGDPLGQVFLISVNLANLNRVIALLPLQTGILSIEVDQVLSL